MAEELSESWQERDIYTERFEKLQNSIEARKKEDKDCDDLEKQLGELKIEEESLKEKENKLNKQVVSWYVDTICKPGFSKMLVNTDSSSTDEKKFSEKFQNFIERHKTALKQFASLKSFEESHKFLNLNPEIIKKQTLYFMISYGIKKYLKQEKNKLKIVARQVVCLQHVLELFKMYNTNNDDILRSFFTTVKLADERCKADFEKETLKVQKLIKSLVKNLITDLENSEKTEETCQEVKNSNKLDPEEVFETLPEEMQYCFYMKDKNGLANILKTMPAVDAQYHMKRCIESGLWIPQ